MSANRDHSAAEDRVAARWLERTARAVFADESRFIIPEKLMAAFDPLVKMMLAKDPRREIRDGGWDVGNFANMTSRGMLSRYNSIKGGVPFSASAGFSVEMFDRIFDERGPSASTGWTLVRQFDDPAIDRLWKKAKREADAFVAAAKRGKTAAGFRQGDEVVFLKAYKAGFPVGSSRYEQRTKQVNRRKFKSGDRVYVQDPNPRKFPGNVVVDDVSGFLWVVDPDVLGPFSGKTAGEVRFIKDRGGDHQEWGWNPPGASERNIDPDYEFHDKNLEPLAKTLRAALMALGHIQTARTTFTKIKSQRISPDGNLGGKGYIMPIKDIRKQLSNCDEALSSIGDCLYDEIQAIHWHPAVDDSGGDPRERGTVRQIMDDVEDIKEDPEEWAEDEANSMDSDKESSISRVAARYMGSRRGQ